MHVEQRLELLEIENARLREEIAFLRDSLVEQVYLPIELRLTRCEELLVGHLLTREMASKPSIMNVLYANDVDEAEIKIVDVFVCKARKKLAPFGIKIETLWGRGYSLPPESKQVLRAMCQA